MSFRSQKPRLYGDAKGVVARAFDEIGVKAAAFALGLKLSRTYELADPDKHKAQISYEQAQKLTLAGATAFADDLAALGGGARRAGGGGCESLGAVMAREERDHASALAVLVRSADDARRLTRAERDDLVRHVDAVTGDLAEARRKLCEAA